MAPTQHPAPTLTNPVFKLCVPEHQNKPTSNSPSESYKLSHRPQSPSPRGSATEVCLELILLSRGPHTFSCTFSVSEGEKQTSFCLQAELSLHPLVALDIYHS